jgi:CRISPR/Cas system CSM-associated protein Csm5 (group 7 of RAMP superfamily)
VKVEGAIRKLIKWSVIRTRTEVIEMRMEQNRWLWRKGERRQGRKREAVFHCYNKIPNTTNSV